MKVLAKRDNTILIAGPLLLVGFVVVFFCFKEKIDLNSFLERFFDIFNIVMIIRFFLRLSVPRVILECDDNFLYVNRKFKETEAIAFKNIIGISDVKEKADFLEMWHYNRQIIKTIEERRRYFYMLVALATTGVINLNYEGGYIRLHGIKNAKQVEQELDRIIRGKKIENQENIDAMVADMKRQKELEELAKHNINT